MAGDGRAGKVTWNRWIVMGRSHGRDCVFLFQGQGRRSAVLPHASTFFGPRASHDVSISNFDTIEFLLRP
jgi:hypothetical protein